MKVFDMHVHVFPEVIAGRAVENLVNHYEIKSAGNGRMSEYKKLLAENPMVKKTLFHSSATAPYQVRSVNDTMAKMKNENMLCFGSIHPDYEHIEQEIDRLIGMGLIGIKLHPDFQGFDADSDKACRIYEYARGKLPILIHAGDMKLPHSHPEKIRRVHDMFPGLTIIAAHLGGYSKWDEAERLLVGTDIYLDTSSSIRYMEKQQAVRIIKNHGIKKCLFGSDYPIHDPAESLDDFLALGFSESENEDILWNNSFNLFCAQ